MAYETRSDCETLLRPSASPGITGRERGRETPTREILIFVFLMSPVFPNTKLPLLAGPSAASLSTL